MKRFFIRKVVGFFFAVATQAQDRDAWTHLGKRISLALGAVSRIEFVCEGDGAEFQFYTDSRDSGEH